MQTRKGLLFYYHFESNEAHDILEVFYYGSYFNEMGLLIWVISTLVFLAGCRRQVEEAETQESHGAGVRAGHVNESSYCQYKGSPWIDKVYMKGYNFIRRLPALESIITVSYIRYFNDKEKGSRPKHLLDAYVKSRPKHSFDAYVDGPQDLHRNYPVYEIVASPCVAGGWVGCSSEGNSREAKILDETAARKPHRGQTRRMFLLLTNNTLRNTPNRLVRRLTKL